MKKKMAIALLLAITLPMAFATAALAANDCDVRIEIEDRTGGLLNEEIQLTFLSIDASEAVNFKIKAGGTVSGKIRKGVEYNIAVFFNSRDRFEVKYTDGLIIDYFYTTKDSYTFYWVASEMTQEIKEEKELWSDFRNQIYKIDVNSRYSGYFVDDFDNDTAAMQFERVTGRKAQVYKDFTLEDKFTWTVTYIAPLYPLLTSDYNVINYNSLYEWERSVIKKDCDALALNAGKDASEAFKKLMRWQYNYLVEHEAMFNFHTGRDSMEECPKNPVLLVKGKGGHRGTGPIENESESESPLIEDASASGDNIADASFKKKVSRNYFTICLSSLVVGGAASFFICKKIYVF